MSHRSRKKEYLKQFRKMTDDEIIRRFNELAGLEYTDKGVDWAYSAALHEELNLREFDYSLIGDKLGLTHMYQIKLEGKKVVYSGLIVLHLHLEKVFNFISQN